MIGWQLPVWGGRFVAVPTGLFAEHDTDSTDSTDSVTSLPVKEQGTMIRLLAKTPVFILTFGLAIALVGLAREVDPFV
jgi:hypothetical protein